MNEQIEQNRRAWNEMTPIHEHSAMYNVAGFKAGQSTLHPLQIAEVGDVRGKSLLHLQCHFGEDTLSWARLGAKVTGLDISDASIELAKRLAVELRIDARFVRSNLYDAPSVLRAQFDVVYTGLGALCWLPDLKRWAEIAASYVGPGGFLYIMEDHPIHDHLDYKQEHDLRFDPPYFNQDPLREEESGSYADRDAHTVEVAYSYPHTLGDIVSTICAAGLRIEFLHEFPFGMFQRLSFSKQDGNGWWRLDGDPLPLLFSLKATKPV